MKKIFTILGIVSIMTLALAACSSSGDNTAAEAPMMTESSVNMSGMARNAYPEDAAYDTNVYYYEEYEQEVYGYDDAAYSATGSSSYSIPQRQLMFIKTANISLQTDTFDSDIESIRNIVAAAGGYYESSNLYSPNERNPRDRKRYNATIRVPVANYEYAKESIENTGKIISSNENTQEVSAEYFNTQSRLDTLRTEEARLIELIEEAEDLKLLIQLEQRLSETKTQIELYESQIKRIESQTSFSTIVVNITEVTPEEMIIPEPVDDSFTARLSAGFKNSVSATGAFLQNLAVFLAYIAVPAAVIIIILLITRILLKRSRLKKAA